MSEVDKTGAQPSSKKRTPPGNDPFSFVCVWLQSALDCKNFVWTPDQHDAASSDLREAQALLAEVQKHAVHIASGGLPDDEKRYTRADMMHMMAVIRALEDYKKGSAHETRASLTDAQCTDVINELAAREWIGLTKQDIRMFDDLIEGARVTVKASETPEQRRAAIEAATLADARRMYEAHHGVPFPENGTPKP